MRVLPKSVSEAVAVTISILIAVVWLQQFFAR